MAVISAGAGAEAQASNSAVTVGPSEQISQSAQPALPQAVEALPTEPSLIDPLEEWLRQPRPLEVPPVERLFGDWYGLQPKLQSLGINIQVDALTEFAGNVSGGTRQGATFANQIGFGNNNKWERLAGITGLSTHVVIVNRSGSNDSRVFGDNLLPVQEIYGSGGNVVAHLVSAYAQETLFDSRIDIALGRMNVENDFASSPLYCSFLNNGLCGDPKALPGGDIGHSAYPDAAWAARVRVVPIPETYAKIGVYEVNTGPL